MMDLRKPLPSRRFVARVVKKFRNLHVVPVPGNVAQTLFLPRSFSREQYENSKLRRIWVIIFIQDVRFHRRVVSHPTS